MTTQFGTGYPVREVAPAPTVRPEFTVDLRRIPGAKHEHAKATGFWAGRTKTSPGFATNERAMEDIKKCAAEQTSHDAPVTT